MPLGTALEKCMGDFSRFYGGSRRFLLELFVRDFVPSDDAAFHHQLGDAAHQPADAGASAVAL